jgi:hypothetical protein
MAERPQLDTKGTFDNRLSRSAISTSHVNQITHMMRCTSPTHGCSGAPSARET